jgi:hypothetical protein
MRFVPYDNGSGLGPSIGGAICNCVYQAPQPPYLPVNIEAPIISGNTVYVSTLTLTGEGIWIGNPPPTLTFQWLRNGAVIGGATSITYVTQLADVGQQITCRVTGTNSVGSVSAISNVITVTSLPSNTIAPVISGNPVAGSTLTTTNGTWTGFPAPTFTYQWLRNGVVIGGATSITYVTQLADVGQQITCRVTGTNSVGSVSAISNVITVTSLPFNVTAPVISGNPVVGSTLTTTNGTWTGFPTPTFTYQWLRNGVVIGGATNTTYVTQLTDVGQQITCRVTGTNSVGSVNAISNIIIPQNVTTPSQTVTFTGTVNFETIYVNSLNQVDTGPVLNGFTIYRVTYTSAGASYVINSNLLSTPISFLIVGGGGTGAGFGIPTQAISPGAGGAGGFRESSGTTNTATTYLIYVGRGGVESNNTANGEDSLLQLTSGTLTAIGGGGGGNLSTSLNGLNGGSGGGGAFNFNNNNFGTGGNGTPGQGFSGAAGLIGTASGGSGGGAGGDASLNGGPGLSSTITGQSIFYAGGGGGLSRSGGIGGGGNSQTPGTDGLGGGGGGGGGSSSGTSGGSGVVILRIPSFA